MRRPGLVGRAHCGFRKFRPLPFRKFCPVGKLSHLVAVFDRPKTVALAWRKNGEMNEWNPLLRLR